MPTDPPPPPRKSGPITGTGYVPHRIYQLDPNRYQLHPDRYSPQPPASSVPSSGERTPTPSSLPAPTPPAPPPPSLSPLPHHHHHQSAPHGPRLTPGFRLFGPPNDVIRSCPGSEPLPFPTHSYRLLSTFSPICSSCHQTFISKSALSSHFVRDEHPTPRSTCQFNVLRITNLIWPACLASNSVEPLHQFFLFRQSIGPCPRFGPSNWANSTKWHLPIPTGNNGSQSRMSFCQACYEDKLVGTGFEVAISKTPINQTGPDPWTCDLAFDHVERLLGVYGRTASWGHFETAASDRLMIQSTCDGSPTHMPDRQWFRCKLSGTDPGLASASSSGLSAFSTSLARLVVCKCCFMDYIQFTHLTTLFEPIPQAEIQPNSWAKCGFSKVAVRMAWAESIDRTSRVGWNGGQPSVSDGGLDVWWTAASAIANSPDCGTGGTSSGGVWYSLSTSALEQSIYQPSAALTIGPLDPTFRVCSACFAGIMVPYGLAGYFQLASPPGSGGGSYAPNQGYSGGVYRHCHSHVRFPITFSDFPTGPRRQTGPECGCAFDQTLDSFIDRISRIVEVIFLGRLDPLVDMVTLKI